MDRRAFIEQTLVGMIGITAGLDHVPELEIELHHHRIWLDIGFGLQSVGTYKIGWKKNSAVIEMRMDENAIESIAKQLKAKYGEA